MATKKEREIYGDLINDFRPSLRTLLIRWFQAKIMHLKREKRPIYQVNAVFIPEEDRLKNLPLQYIALSIDGKVKELIRINERTAEILLDNKIQMIAFDPSETVVKIGYLYDKELGFYPDKDEDDKED